MRANFLILSESLVKERGERSDNNSDSKKDVGGGGGDDDGDNGGERGSYKASSNDVYSRQYIYIHGTYVYIYI